MAIFNSYVSLPEGKWRQLVHQVSLPRLLRCTSNGLPKFPVAPGCCRRNCKISRTWWIAGEDPKTQSDTIFSTEIETGGGPENLTKIRQNQLAHLAVCRLHQCVRIFSTKLTKPIQVVFSNLELWFYPWLSLSSCRVLVFTNPSWGCTQLGASISRRLIVWRVKAPKMPPLTWFAWLKPLLGTLTMGRIWEEYGTIL